MSEDMRFATLDKAFAYYTECALATAEGLDTLKSASQHARRRAWNIANGMVAVCRQQQFIVRQDDRLPRLRRLLEDAQ